MTVSDKAKKCLGMCKSAKKKTWFNASFKEIIDRRNKLQEIALKPPTNENIKQYTAGRKEVNKTLRREKILEEKRKIEEIENNSYNPKQFFNASNKKEIAKEYKIYFDKLLNNTTRTNEYTNIQYSSVRPFIRNQH